MLNYLLFEAQDEDAFIRSVEAEVKQQFDDIPRNNSQYLIKKSVRKILRFVNKQVKYSGKKETEAQLRLHFCRCMKDSISMRYSTTLTNLYEQQLKRINTAISKLHEDLQYDYQRELERLSQ